MSFGKSSGILVSSWFEDGFSVFSSLSRTLFLVPEVQAINKNKI